MSFQFLGKESEFYNYLKNYLENTGLEFNMLSDYDDVKIFNIKDNKSTDIFNIRLGTSKSNQITLYIDFDKDDEYKTLVIQFDFKYSKWNINWLFSKSDNNCVSFVLWEYEKWK